MLGLLYFALAAGVEQKSEIVRKNRCKKRSHEPSGWLRTSKPFDSLTLARDSRRRVGVRDLARWTGSPRTANAEHRKASDLVRPSVEEEEANALAEVAANALAEGAANGAVAGVKRSQPGW